MKKIVINKCYGGFGLSDEALRFLGMNQEGQPHQSIYDIPRDDPRLVECVEKLGEEAGAAYSKLRIVEIPDDVEWCIVEYDGMERVEDVHRVWD